MRERTEEALRNSERVFRVIFDETLEFIGLMSVDGTLLQANRAALDSIGAAAPEVTGKPFWDTPWWSHSPRLQAELRDAVKSALKGKTVRFEASHKTKEGSLLYIDFSIKPVLDDAGNVVLLIPEGRDITERKRAEEALKRSEDNLERAQKITGLGNWEWDLRTNLLSGSREYYRIFGLEYGTPYPFDIFTRMLHPDDKKWIDNAIKDIRYENLPHGYVFRILAPGGGLKYIHFDVDVIRDGNGRPVKVFGTVQDITERKLAEIELERVNRALRAISKCNEAVIHAKKVSALLHDICQAIVEVGGYRMAWIGCAMDDAQKSIRPIAKAGFEDDYVEKARISWADTERGRGPTGTAVRSKKPYIIKYVTTDPDFAPWRDDAIRMGYNSVIGLPLMAGDRAFGVLTIYAEKPDAFDPEEVVLLQDMAANITHGILSLRNRIKRAEAEAALKAAKAEAELYVDLMGHDINNMNQVSIGFIELARNIIEMDGKLGEDNIGLLDKAMDSLRNSSQLIDNVRKIQREKLGLYRPEVVDVGKMAREAVEQFKSSPGRNVKITCSAADDCLVRANALLRDVFINLIGNAVKHSRGDLSVNIRVSPALVDGRPCCRVCVEDDGPGISDKMKSTLFDRLNLTATRAKGKGFGLCLIKMLVDDYDGQFYVEDRIKGDYTKGTRFLVILPMAENP